MWVLIWNSEAEQPVLESRAEHHPPQKLWITLSKACSGPCYAAVGSALVLELFINKTYMMHGFYLGQPPYMWGLKDHRRMRILLSGSQDQDNGDSRKSWFVGSFSLKESSSESS